MFRVVVWSPTLAEAPSQHMLPQLLGLVVVAEEVVNCTLAPKDFYLQVTRVTSTAILTAKEIIWLHQTSRRLRNAILSCAQKEEDWTSPPIVLMTTLAGFLVP